jgi:hypothetical protein
VGVTFTQCRADGSHDVLSAAVALERKVIDYVCLFAAGDSAGDGVRHVRVGLTPGPRPTPSSAFWLELRSRTWTSVRPTYYSICVTPSLVDGNRLFGGPGGGSDGLLAIYTQLLQLVQESFVIHPENRRSLFAIPLGPVQGG